MRKLRSAYALHQMFGSAPSRAQALAYEALLYGSALTLLLASIAAPALV